MVTMQLIAKCFEVHLTQCENYARYGWYMAPGCNFDRTHACTQTRRLFKSNLACLEGTTIDMHTDCKKLLQLVPIVHLVCT